MAIDTFYIEWDKEKRAVFTMLDEFSGYEIDCEIKDENAEMEIGLFQPTWAKNYGYPKVLRLDASGPHQSETYAEWASNHGIKMELIPTGAHHRLGILERNHAVRRKTLETFKAELPDCTFEKALLVTAHQRNRLSSVKGATPAAFDFGYVPSEGGVMDISDPFSSVKWRGSRLTINRFFPAVQPGDFIETSCFGDFIAKLYVSAFLVGGVKATHFIEANWWVMVFVFHYVLSKPMHLPLQ